MRDTIDMAREAGFNLNFRITGSNEALDRLVEYVRADERALAAPVQEPVAWKWHQAPIKTSWGHDMVVADLAIDKDNTVSVYCERDQITKVEAMFSTPPTAQPAPVQELMPDDLIATYEKGFRDGQAAQRTWVGLTDEDVYPLANEHLHYQMEGYEVSGIYNLARAIEARLKGLNT